MANTLARLLGRRGGNPTPQEAPSDGAPPVNIDVDALPLAGTLDESPSLVPAAIYSQPLFAPNELTPAWLQPRPSPAPNVVTSVPPTLTAKPTKRPSRPKASGASSTSRPSAKRGTKRDHEATDR
jgi:hypothetical protein